MKVYYILSVLAEEDKEFFFKSIRELNKPEDIDNIIKTKYYRVNQKTIGTTYNSIILETWIFIKKIWENYGIDPKNINWVYRQNMVILNDDLWLFNNKNNIWEKVSGEKKVYFFTSRYSFRSIFWSFWEEISKYNSKFPKLIFPNKELKYTKKEKIRYIMNSYKKRKKIIGDFMLPLMYTRNNISIKNLLLLWKQEIGESNILIKKSWATDNGKHISLINVDEYIENDQKLDYLFLKYISSTSEFNSGIYFSKFYEIEKEFRLYYSKDNLTGEYNLYSAKEKINLTSKEELFKKSTLRTGQDLRVSWDLIDFNDIPNDLEKAAKYILKRNSIEVGVIEFVRLSNGQYRFLEINCLGGSMMFAGKDEENIKSRISNWWIYLFNNNI